MQLTADTIAISFKNFLPVRPDIVALSGGGALNPIMVHAIFDAVNAAYGSSSSIANSSSTSYAAHSSSIFEAEGPLHQHGNAVIVVPCSKLLGSLGVQLGHAAGGCGDGGSTFNFDDAKEALAFAVLAHERVNFFAGVTSLGTNVVTATGATRCVSLGQLSLPTPTK